MAQLQPFVIAILVGLLIGIEREKAHPNSNSMGVRSFLLLSLLGSLAAWIQQPFVQALVVAFALALVVLSYSISIRVKSHQQKDLGLTTEIAGIVVFCLGYGAHFDPVLTIILGPIVALVLFMKKPLHQFTDRIKPNELEATIVLLLIFVGVVNLLEDRVVDPWGLFNPRKFGLLVLLLATLEFVSYLAVKFLGERKSPWVVGILAGLVSSTAALLSTGREARENPTKWRRLAATALVPKLASIGELILILILVSPALVLSIWPAALASLMVGSLFVFFVWRNKTEHSSSLNLPSPLNLRGVLRLAVFLASVLAVVAIAQKQFGDMGSHVVAFLTGLFELQGISLATATLFSRGTLGAEAASKTLIIALLASLFAKVLISIVISRGPFARVMSLAYFTMAAAAAIGTYLLKS